MKVIFYNIIFCTIMFCFLGFSSCKNSIENKHKTEDMVVSIDTTPLPIGGIDINFFKKEGDAYVLPWKYLLSTKFEEKYSETMTMEVSLPIFSDTLKVLNEKNVIVEGYYIPVDETGDDKIVILSAFPFAQCFFCGNAGVESIIDVVSPKKVPPQKVDNKIKFKGRLKLNKDNFDYLIYILEDAELVL